jgi:hypothetical protein
VFFLIILSLIDEQHAQQQQQIIIPTKSPQRTIEPTTAPAIVPIDDEFDELDVLDPDCLSNLYFN